MSCRQLEFPRLKRMSISGDQHGSWKHYTTKIVLRVHLKQNNNYLTSKRSKSHQTQPVHTNAHKNSKVKAENPQNSKIQKSETARTSKERYVGDTRSRRSVRGVTLPRTHTRIGCLDVTEEGRGGRLGRPPPKNQPPLEPGEAVRSKFLLVSRQQTQTRPHSFATAWTGAKRAKERRRREKRREEAGKRQPFGRAMMHPWSSPFSQNDSALLSLWQYCYHLYQQHLRVCLLMIHFLELRKDKQRIKTRRDARTEKQKNRKIKNTEKIK